MTRRIWRIRLLCSLGAVFSLAAAVSASAATTIGSNLNASVNEVACGFGTFHATDRPCLVAQESLISSHTATGLTAPSDGVIVRWRVRSGTAGPDTASVKLRLRLLHGTTGVGGGAGAYVALPLGEPGLHVFPTRLPVKAGDRIGLDTLTSDKEIEGAGVPIVHFEPGVGNFDEWPTLLDGESLSPNSVQEDEELLLNADIEPDADHDGYGDETQDLCPTNPALQTACPATADTTPPKTKLTYAGFQDFLGSHEVVVHLRSNEAAKALATGQLEIPAEHTTWGISSSQAQVKAHKKATLRLLVPPKARKAAKRALRKGEKVVAKVVVSATDLAGNESGKTVATVKQKRRKH